MWNECPSEVLLTFSGNLKCYCLLGFSVVTRQKVFNFAQGVPY